MDTLQNPENTLKWYHIYQKFVKPHIQNFLETPPLKERFENIFCDIREGKIPSIISEKISIELKFELDKHFKLMTPFQYKEFAEEILFSLLNCFKYNVVVWKDKIINFKDVSEIWIACEPILDLVDEEEGAFELLVKQIESVDKIIYFLENRTFYDELILLLKKVEIPTDKLEFVKINKKLVEPVVLYRTPLKFFGVYGAFHPTVKKLNNGFYSLSRKLAPDWMKYLSREDVSDTELKLKSYLN